MGICFAICEHLLDTKVSVLALWSAAHRAVAPSPAGPAMAGPVFAAGTKILNIEDMHSKHTFKLGGYWPKVKLCSKSRVVLLQCCRT